MSSPLGHDRSLCAWLEDAFKRARDAYPDIVVEEQLFAERLTMLGDSDAARREMRVADVYLALALAQGDEAALRVFREDYAKEIQRALAKVQGAEIELEDLRQHLYERLFSPRDKTGPRILEYRGRSTLRRWLRAVMVRLLLDRARDTRRANRRRDRAMRDLEQETVRLDPEVAVFRTEFRMRFRTAFAEALDELPARQRLLLRQRIVDNLGLDEMADLYQVHRATAARWLAAARDALASATRGKIIGDRSLSPDELRSIDNHCRSAIDTSFVELVRGKGTEDDAG